MTLKTTPGAVAAAAGRQGHAQGASIVPSMSPADTLLPRLDGVRQRGQDQWSARCPAHDDKSPSLSIKEVGDGRVLVHCFGGCSVESVLGAVGLDMTALFPPRPSAPGAGTKPSKLRLPAAQALDILAFESMLIAIVGSDMVRKKTISEADHTRLLKAVGRVGRIAEAAR